MTTGSRTPIPGCRLIAADVDGTVLTPEHTITPATRTAVARAREQGAVVVLTSSRSPVGLRAIIAGLDLDAQWFIAYQGALVARWTQDGTLSVLAETLLDRSVARTIEEQALSKAMSVGRYTRGRWFVPRIDVAITREAAITGETPLQRASAQLDDAPAPHKLLIIAPDDDAIARLHQFASSLPPTVTAAFSHPAYFEITATGVDKAHGLRALADHLNISLHEAAAIGDGRNDIAMFGAVNVAIAMGQARADVRSAAQYTTFSNRADGLAQALNNLHISAVITPDHDSARRQTATPNHQEENT